MKKSSGRKSFIRAVESLIAIVMVIATFQAFVNWSLPERGQAMTRETGYDLMSTYSGSAKNALYDFYSFDQFVSYAVPAGFSYKTQGDFFTPISADPEKSPQTVYVDFPAVINSSEVFVTDLSTEEYSSSVDFNHYRVPFAVQNLGADFSNSPVYVALTLPSLDANYDGTVDLPSLSSLDLYFDGKRVPFILHSAIEFEDLLSVTVLFNATIQSGKSGFGYLYFLTGAPEERLKAPQWTESETSGQTIKVITRAIERAPRATITFVPPNERKTVYVVSRIGYPVYSRERPTNISIQDTGSELILNSTNLSVSIGKLSGTYSVFDRNGARKVFEAVPEIIGGTFSVTVPPHRLNSTISAGKISAHWQLNSTLGKVDYFATVYEGKKGNGVLIQRRVVYAGSGSYSPRLDSVHFSEPGSIVDTWLEGGLSKGVVVFDSHISTGVFPETPKAFPFNGTHLYPQDSIVLGAYEAKIPYESETLYVFGDAVLGKERRAGEFGRDKRTIDASSQLVFTSPTELQFDYYFSGKSPPQEVLANFTVRRRFNNSLTLTCDLGANRIFTDLLVPAFFSVTEERYIQKTYSISRGLFSGTGTESFFCSVNQTNLTIESIELTAIDYSGEEGFERFPVTIENRALGDRTFEFSVNLEQIGLSGQNPSKVFVVDGETGILMNSTYSSGNISFRSLVPAGGISTSHVVFARSEASFPESTPAETNPVEGSIPYYGITLGESIHSSYADIGEVETLGKTYWANPPDNPNFPDKEISPTADATVAQTFVFDEKTGRGGSIKLMLWRKV